MIGLGVGSTTRQGALRRDAPRLGHIIGSHLMIYSTNINDSNITSNYRHFRADRHVIRYDLYNEAHHVAEWEPHNVHDLSIVARVSWVGSALCTDPAKYLRTAF